MKVLSLLNHRWRLITTLFLCVASIPANAASTAMPTIVELFTSQGCSSCPPAEILLGELAQDPNIIALAYHVDYWDDLGWRDRFGIPEAAQRQRGYARALHLSGVFTPQSIINGRSSVLGSNRRALTAAGAVATEAIPIKLAVSGGVLSVALDERPISGSLDVNLISYLPEAATAIGRGENSGRTLREFNIVRSIQTLTRWDGRSRTLNVPRASLPADASKVVVLIQQANQGHIAGAATANLR